MSKILKRPMFRKGGEVSEGVMKLAMGGRAKYQEGTTLDPNDPLLKDAQRREALLTQLAGAPRNTKQDLYDLLISGGLNLMGGTGAGDGTIASVARSFKEPTEKFLATRTAEEDYKRKIKMAAAQGAISAKDAMDLLQEKSKFAARDKSYESGTIDARFKTFVEALRSQPGAKKELGLAYRLEPQIKKGFQKGVGINYAGTIEVTDPKTKRKRTIIDPTWIQYQPDGVRFIDPIEGTWKIIIDGVVERLDQDTLTPIKRKK